MRINLVFLFSLLATLTFNTTYAAENVAVQKEVVAKKTELAESQGLETDSKDPSPKNDEPIVQPFDFNHNDLYRSYLNTHDITQVDTFTGNMTIRLPLLNIPGNDHLPLQVTLIFDNTLVDTFTDIFTLGYGWSMSPGVYNIGKIEDPGFPDEPFSKMPSYTPVFLAPDGTRHTLYSLDTNCIATSSKPHPAGCNDVKFISKDNWRADLSLSVPEFPTLTTFIYQGTVIAPDGTTYQIINPLTPTATNPDSLSPVSTITSPNGGTVLTYHYDANNGLASISRNDGFSVNFKNTPVIYHDSGSLFDNYTFDRIDQMQTSDGRTWQFNYQDFQFQSDTGNVVPTLISVNLPNNTQWKFLPAANGFAHRGRFNIQLNQVTSPTGLTATFTYGNNTVDTPSPENAYYYADRIAIPYVLTKTLSGSISEHIFNYSFDKMKEQDGTYYYTNQTTVSDGVRKIVYTFDATQNAFQSYEYPYTPIYTPQTGTLLEEAIYDPYSGVLMQDTKYTWTKRDISNYPPKVYGCDNSPRTNPCQSIDGFPTTMTTPELQQKTITRDGATYTTAYSNYDQYGYPAHIMQTSAAGSINEDLTYYEDTNKWIFKPQNDTASDGSGVVNSITRQFDANGNMTQQTTNGVATNYAYDGSGNLTSQTDAANNTTTFANYVAGMPEMTTNAMDGVTKRDINTDGTVNSVTDPNNFTTNYTYDPLYRLTSITPPQGLPTTLDWIGLSGNKMERIQGLLLR